jgi:hypothetical protein
MLERGESKQFQQTSLRERGLDAGERGKQAVEANKLQREGLMLGRRVISSSSKLSNNVDLMLRKGDMEQTRQIVGSSNDGESKILAYKKFQLTTYLQGGGV